MIFKTSFTIQGKIVPKPRQTHKDRFAPSDRVLLYRTWADEARLAATGNPKKKIDQDFFGLVLVCHFAIPQSWSKKKKEDHQGNLHHQIPDADNCIKSLQDALFERDEYISWTQCIKLWAYEDEEPRCDVFLMRNSLP